ncbi:hypothetical protein ACFL6S_27265, partial [Candidatus Poribacteria bacterium]
MARRRNRRTDTGFAIKKGKSVQKAPSDPQERYEWAIASGQEVRDLLSAKLARNPTSQGMRGFFPQGSVGEFLRSVGSSKLKDVYDYYSRSEIQQAMFKYAAGRKITFLRLFKPQYNRIASYGDILPLVLCILRISGKHWPSLHGTVSKTTRRGQTCDVVMEVDFKSSWKKCFEMTRPIVDMLRDRGAVFRLKFSGNCSVHIVIPGEFLRIQGTPVDHSRFFRSLSDLAKKRLKEPRYLDTSFHMPNHFLRLAYSVNENTGLVSLPFEIGDYDHFDPSQAHPKNVRPLPGWWSFPKDAQRQMEDFIRSVMRGNIALSSRSVAVDIPATPSSGWQVDQKVVRAARQRKRQEARQFLPNEGFYDRMVRLGQDMIDLREFLLLEDRASKLALRTVKHLRAMGQKLDLNSIAREFDVDESDLKLLWDWELKERAFRYYAQDEIKQAIYERAEMRKIRVGNEDKLVFLQEPADLMPLIVYAHLASKRARDEYPAVYSTNSLYERTGEIPISCDLKIEFSTRGEDEILEAMTPVLSLLAGFGITHFMFFDGVKGPNAVIPYEAFPEKSKLASVAHDNALARLAPHLKRAMRVPGATCTLVRDPHALSLIPYSIHPQTGLACIPVQFSDLRSFSERDAWLGNVQVDNEWWDVPE